MKKQTLFSLLAILTAGSASWQPTAHAISHFHNSYTPVRYLLHATATAAGEPAGVSPIAGTASITATIDLVAQAFCYQVTTSGVPGNVRGIIGSSPSGKIGKKIIPIASVEFGSKHMSCVAAKASLLQAIVNSPSEYYFEIQPRKSHNSGIRGQFHF